MTLIPDLDRSLQHGEPRPGCWDHTLQSPLGGYREKIEQENCGGQAAQLCTYTRSFGLDVMLAKVPARRVVTRGVSDKSLHAID
jgi:hypothetical protein